MALTCPADLDAQALPDELARGFMRRPPAEQVEPSIFVVVRPVVSIQSTTDPVMTLGSAMTPDGRVVQISAGNPTIK